MKMKMKLKKHSISLVIVLVSIVSIAAPLYSISRNRTGTAEKTTPARKRTGSKTQKLDRVHFWNAVVKALKKDGYAADSREVQHAQRYLQRAQARQESTATRARKNGMSNALEHRARTTENHRNRQTAASRKQADRQTTRQPL